MEKAYLEGTSSCRRPPAERRAGGSLRHRDGKRRVGGVFHADPKKGDEHASTDLASARMCRNVMLSFRQTLHARDNHDSAGSTR
jgi:hypothetical protein